MMGRSKVILLTGKTGQVGWELYQSLMPLGKLIIPDRHEFDLSNPDSLREKIRQWKPDIIVNPAAYTAVDQAEDDHELAFLINSEAPKIMAEEAEKLNIPLVHYSTDYVFDGTKKRPYKENDAPNPLNVYGESKLKGELAIQDTTEQHLILRTGWVYSHRGNNFMKTMLRLFREHSEIKVVNDQFGAPTSARLIAEVTGILLRDVLRGDHVTKGLYHLTAGGSTSWYGFAKEILASYEGSKPDIIPISSSEYSVKADRPAITLLDNSKIVASTGIVQPDWKSIMTITA